MQWFLRLQRDFRITIFNDDFNVNNKGELIKYVNFLFYSITKIVIFQIFLPKHSNKKQKKKIIQLQQMQIRLDTVHWSCQSCVISPNVTESYYVLQRYTYRAIQMKLILLCVWAERAVFCSAKTDLEFKY